MNASLIIRTRNEERWIASCLRAVFSQHFKDFEVILVDNQSTDRTVEKARCFDIQVLSIEDFTPGKALNLGIRASQGQFIVCLSGHCIPTNKDWLANLLRSFDAEQVAGVYGRQQPMSYSHDIDKRDLITVFGLDRRVQQRDSFFHNANSAVRRDVWEMVPFDESVTNIEDRVWANEMIRRGYHLVYDPDASVFHYHGIHQAADPVRCRNVVRIIESLQLGPALDVNHLSLEDQHTVAIIPVRGRVEVLGGRPLLEYTIEHALAAKHVDRVVVSTDNSELGLIAERAGAQHVILRPPELSADFIDIDAVLRYTIETIENEGVNLDIVLLLEVTYPFRPHGFLDRVLQHLVEKGVDSVLPVRPEYKSVWKAYDGSVQRLDEGSLPRVYKDPIHIGLKGLAFATHPKLIRDGIGLGENIGLLEVEDLRCAIEVRDELSFQIATQLIQYWDVAQHSTHTRLSASADNEGASS